MSVANDPKQNLIEEEECVDWGSDAEESPDPEKGTASAGGDVAQSDGSLCVAICTLCAAVPALIGSWCCPILVGAIFAVAAGNVNGGLVKFFHGVQVAIMFALMTNIVQFAYWNVQKKRKKRGHWYMYRPVYLLMVSTVLVLLQPTCMLIIGSWICDGAFSTDQLDATVTSSNATGFYFKNGTYAGHYNSDGRFLHSELYAPVTTKAGTMYADGCDPEMKNFFFDGGQTNALVPNTTTGWMIQLFGTYLGFIFMFVGVCQATMLHKKIADKWSQIRSGAV